MEGFVSIKVADGRLYPVLTASTPAAKRLVLTTAHDGQQSARIHLYLTTGMSWVGARFLGSLVVNHILPRNRGEASLELILALDNDAILDAACRDVDRPDARTVRLSTPVDAAANSPAIAEPSPTTDADADITPVPSRRIPAGDYADADTVRALTAPRGAYRRRRAAKASLAVAGVVVFVAAVAFSVWFFFARVDDATYIPEATSAPQTALSVPVRAVSN
jgi:hypothetical protein